MTDPNYIDPVLGLWLVIIAWTVYGVILVLERRS